MGSSSKMGDQEMGVFRKFLMTLNEIKRREQA